MPVIGTDPRSRCYGGKFVLIVGLAALVVVTGLVRLNFFVIFAALAVGFLAPDLWLGNRVKNRQKQIRSGLPDALDLMVFVPRPD